MDTINLVYDVAKLVLARTGGGYGVGAGRPTRRNAAINLTVSLCG